MSQQMEFDEIRGEQRQAPFNTYSAGYHDPFIGSSGQKLSMRDVTKGASAGQRLALAIISIIMLVPLTGIVMGVTYSNPVTLVGGLIALGLICLTIIAVNIAFNVSR